MENINNTLQPIFDQMGGLLWGWPMIMLLIGTGIYLTIALHGLQFRTLWRSLKMIFAEDSHNDKNSTDGDITHFQALMTALSATVGTGNIAGVATAIALGGPGALFWMWITGILGMITKFSEAVLGVHYREKGEDGTMQGGPMYYITNGMGKRWKWLAVFFCVALAVAALGIGNMVQSNSVADAISNTFNFARFVYDGKTIIEVTTASWVIGIVMSILVAMVIIGGITRIAKVASTIVPVMILIYVGFGILILILNAEKLPEIFAMIFNDAFAGTAAAGGFAGAMVKEVMRYGFSRGVFSNESGCGSAPIAAAAAKTHHPVEQALISMTQTFIDTIIVCTFTGLIILTSGLWQSIDPSGVQLNGAALTAKAYGDTLNWQIMGSSFGSIIVSICLIFFAFSTIIGWYYYGEKGIVFLFGNRSIKPYQAIFITCTLFGVLMQLKLVWSMAEVFTGLMIIPNLIALIFLSGKVRALTLDYFRNEKDKMGYAVEPFYEDSKK